MTTSSPRLDLCATVVAAVGVDSGVAQLFEMAILTTRAGEGEDSFSSSTPSSSWISCILMLCVVELLRHQRQCYYVCLHTSCHICTVGDDFQALIWDFEILRVWLFLFSFSCYMFSCDLGFLNLGFDSICVFIVEIDFIFDDSLIPGFRTG